MSELAELREKIDQVAGTLADVRATVEGINATLKATAARNREEIAALFAARGDHEKRIGGIERDYTPRDTCDGKHAENREEHLDFGQRIGRLDVSVGKIIALTTAANGLVWGGLQVAIHMLRSKGA